jgi:hypothetical protein
MSEKTMDKEKDKEKDKDRPRPVTPGRPHGQR